MPPLDIEPVEGNPFAPAAQPFLDAAQGVTRPYIEITPNPRPQTAQVTPDVLASGFAGGVAPVRSAPQAAQPFLDMAALMGQRGPDLTPLEPGYRARRPPEAQTLMPPEFLRNPADAARETARREVARMRAADRSPDPLDAALQLGGGPGGSALAIFAGPAAKTANLAALRTAEMMASQGRPREEIWSTTGWFQGADKKWRFEIPDRPSTMKGAGTVSEITAKRGENVESALFHPELYEAYPQIGKTELFGGEGPGTGGYTGEIFGQDILPSIRVSSGARDPRSTLLHELQHGVQETEGFARGANTLTLRRGTPAWDIYQERLAGIRSAGNVTREEFSRNAGYEGLAPKADYDNFVRQTRNISPTIDRAAQEYAVQEAYKRAAGEVEARNVQARAGMTPEQLRQRPPWTTEDVPREQQIVRMGSGGDVQASIEKFIRAYHGSPYDFERFDLSKIGTGEGAQAYGHGLYFAENPAVAQEYKKQLSPSGATAAELNARRTLEESGGDVQSALQTLRARAANTADTPWIAKQHEEAAKVLESGLPANRMYEVSIAADPDHFLHWDKPLSEQSEYVQQRLGQLGLMRGTEGGQFAGHEVEFAPPTGAEAYKRLMPERILQGGSGDKTYPIPFRNDVEATQALRDAGIPGIKYLDQGSRGTSAITQEIADWERRAAQPMSYADRASMRAHIDSLKELQRKQTHNYVVFDDRLINIVRKFGMAGVALVGAGYELVPVGDNRDPFAQ